MEKEFDINNLTQDDFMEMAAYVAMSEKKNVELLNELREVKAYLSATLQQRNSAEQKYQNLLADKALKTVPITEAVVMNSSFDLINPEQWAVPEGRVSKIEKSDKQ
jgi:hypothetical protein